MHLCSSSLFSLADFGGLLELVRSQVIVSNPQNGLLLQHASVVLPEEHDLRPVILRSRWLVHLPLRDCAFRSLALWYMRGIGSLAESVRMLQEHSVSKAELSCMSECTQAQTSCIPVSNQAFSQFVAASCSSLPLELTAS